MRRSEQRIADVRPKIRLGRTAVTMVLAQASAVGILFIAHVSSGESESESTLLVIADILLLLPAVTFAAVLAAVTKMRLPVLSALVTAPMFFLGVGTWSKGFWFFTQALSSPSPKRVAELRKRIAASFNTDLPLLVTEALLAARAGETERARSILHGVIRVPPSGRHAFMRVYAAQWLCRDALARNAFEEIRALPPVPGSTLALLAWIDVARSIRLAQKYRPQARPAAASGLSDALRAHTALARGERDCDGAILAWDRVLASHETRERLTRRAHELGGSGEQVWATFRSQIERDLAHAIGEQNLGPEAAATALGQDLLDTRRRRAMDELDDRASALKARMTSKRFVPAADEWAEVTALRLCYEQCLSLGAVPADALQVVRQTAWNYSVWLHNDFGEIDIAYVNYSWLHLECAAQGRAEDARILKNNAVNASS